MKLSFDRNSSLQLRFIVALLIALIIIISDSQFNAFNQIRLYMDTIISPFYFISDAPRKLLDNISKTFSSRFQLELKNRLLYRELLLIKSDLLLLAQYKQENAHLRELLGSPLRQNERKIVTKVLSKINNPYSHQIIIDKGSIHGVYEGQPVINDKGIVGQVIAVAKLTSRVLLICDSSHAVPIQVLRNDIRVIATGNGCTDNLSLEYLPINTDIQVGDILITSGLGGKFPEGYPVGVVSSVKLDTQHSYIIIQARPTANLHRLHYLLLWIGNHDNKLITPEEIHNIASKRLTEMSVQSCKDISLNHLYQSIQP